MQIKRDPNWRSQLASYVESVARLPLRPGRHDCALFAAGAVEAMTGVDFARGFRGYRTLSEGRAKLAGKGFAGLDELAASFLPEIAPAKARAGDVVALTDDEGHAALGIVQGGKVYVLRPSVMGFVDLTKAERAFKV